MIKKIVSMLLVLIFMSACSPIQQGTSHPPAAPSVIETTKEIGENERIGNAEDVVLKSGTLDGHYSTEETIYLGNEDARFVFFSRDHAIWQVDLETNEESELAKLESSEGHYAFSFEFEKPWLIWSESKDKETYVGASIGEDWSIWALNIETGEKIKIDGENEFFPKERDFMPMPWVLSCCDNILTYSGYEADETGVYKAVKMFDFNTRELTTLIRQNEENKGYSYGNIDKNRIVFSLSLMEEGELRDNIIYSYNISDGKLSIIENQDNLALPNTSGQYIAAIERYHQEKMEDCIYVLDTQLDKWTRIIDHKTKIYEDIPESSTMGRHTAQMCGDYMVWQQTADDRLYVFNIRENTFYDVLEADRRVTNISPSFENNMLIWRDTALDYSDAQYKYVVLK